MNKDKYQKLRDKIIEANPSIVNLEFGCWIKYKKYNIYTQRYKTFTSRIVKAFCCKEKKYENISTEIHQSSIMVEKNVLEIIGRDITVLDIMKTLGGYYAVDGRGALFELQEVEGKTAKWIYKLLPCTFDFNKPLQDQSDKTKDFLFNLLK